MAITSTNYILSPNAHAIRQFTKQISELQGSIPRNVNEIQKLIINYEKTFLRIVASVRGYLFLTNVVMGGDLSEFVHLSKKVKADAVAKRGPIQDNISRIFTVIQNASYLSTILVTLLALGTAVFVSRQFIKPVGLITKTLNDLAKGTRQINIPEIERNDEIGDMAKAANVFKLKELGNSGSSFTIKDDAEGVRRENKGLRKIEFGNGAICLHGLS